MNAIIEQIRTELPLMVLADRPKRARTVEHTFIDMVAQCIYTTYVNGYVRRTILNRWGVRQQIPINPRKATNKRLVTYDYTGKAIYKADWEVVKLDTEDQRLARILKMAKKFRK